MMINLSFVQPCSQVKNGYWIPRGTVSWQCSLHCSLHCLFSSNVKGSSQIMKVFYFLPAQSFGMSNQLFLEGIKKKKCYEKNIMSPLCSEFSDSNCLQPAF